KKPEPHCQKGNARLRFADHFLWGRIAGAALSSTPLTNLWLSSAPKVFASSIASLMATLYGTSSRLDSSNSAIRNTAFSTWPSSSSRRDRYGFIRPSRYALLVATPDSSSRKYRTSTSFTSCSDRNWYSTSAMSFWDNCQE